MIYKEYHNENDFKQNNYIIDVCDQMLGLGMLECNSLLPIL
jgi:hypothetical protein